jgi:hypothetical protein
LKVSFGASLSIATSGDWLNDRNIHNVKADWRSPAADARIKLKSLSVGTLVDPGH